MHGSLVYTNTALDSTDGVVNFNHHTYGVYMLNKSTSTAATIKLNGFYEIYLHHMHNQSGSAYVFVPGDYTTIECVTADVSIAVYAVG